MEKRRNGRPSRILAQSKFLYKRKYAFQKLKSIFPTGLGMDVNSFLTENFLFIWKSFYKE